MNKILLIYAAVIFIGGVILFTYAQLQKDKEIEEPETNKWMRILSIIVIALAAMCLLISRMAA
jgi:hypothetical protein